MPEHLTPLDATFLELEQADDSAHMHIGAIMVFDPIPRAGAPTREQVGELLSARLGQLPRYRQRLSTPHTGGLSWPAWAEVPEFEVADHLSRAALPRPGGQRELAEWSSSFFSERLDRRRPLWEMVLVEGLAEGRWALASKTHHCMVDGVGSVDVGHLLLDASPSPASQGPGAAAERAPRGGVSSPALSALSRVWEGLSPLEGVAHVTQSSVHGVLHPRETLSRAGAAMRLIVEDELHAAPHTSLNEQIGTRRRFEVMRVPLQELRTIKNALGGTINDVVVTICATGLRALLDSRGEPLPEAGLRAMVPMNVRLAAERLALGNKISSLFMDVPIADPRTIERYFETVARSTALKSDGRQARGTDAVLGLAGLAPPVLHSAIARALYATRLFNVTITNVPGPQQTLYALGAPLREVHPLVPLAAEHAVGVAIVSYDGSAFFGVVADRDTVPDLGVMLAAMSAARVELLEAARPAAKRSARKARTTARAR
jgi:WS/DGAT/MGAT family acyltransferase